MNLTDDQVLTPSYPKQDGICLTRSWKNPKSFYQGRILSLSRTHARMRAHTHTHTHTLTQTQVFMTCSTSYSLCDTHASMIYMCVLASIPVSRNGSATLVTIKSAEG